MENKDKVYTFGRWWGGDSYSEIEVSEENLDAAQKQYLYAELLEQWNYSPKEVQMRFLNEVVHETKMQMYENHSRAISALLNTEEDDLRRFINSREKKNGE